MTKTITIDWNGGSRRIELQDIPRDEKTGWMAAAPLPLKMNIESLAWINATINRGSDLEGETIESMKLSTGLGILGEIMAYWGEIDDQGDEESTEKGEGSVIEGFDLNEDGAVDVEDYR